MQHRPIVLQLIIFSRGSFSLHKQSAVPIHRYIYYTASRSACLSFLKSLRENRSSCTRTFTSQLVMQRSTRWSFFSLFWPSIPSVHLLNTGAIRALVIRCMFSPLYRNTSFRWCIQTVGSIVTQQAAPGLPPIPVPPSHLR